MKRAQAKPKAVAGATHGQSAWALIAVSSEAQAETLPHQRAWAEETAKANGWRLTRIVEGRAQSGKEGPRRVVRELMADLRALDPEARPKILMMVRADRLGRGSIVEAQVVLRDLLYLGVQVYTRDQRFIKLDSAMSELISAATLAVAAHENEVRSEKMTAVYRRRRVSGEVVGNRPPYGLLRKAGKFVPDGKRGDVVREAFKLRLQGQGFDAIGKRLRTIAPPQAYKNGRSRVIRWTATRVSRLLANRHYVGAIVSEADFARAARVSEKLATGDRSSDRRRRYPWPLAGALRCYCGRVMIGIAGGQRPWIVRYYGCRYGPHDVSVRLVRADALEDQFVDILKRLRASPALIERYRRRADAPVSSKLLERNARELKVRLADLDRKRASAWDLHVSGRVRAEDVQERLDDIARERDEVKARLSEVQEQIAIAKSRTERNRDVDELFKRAARIFESAGEPEQRKIARALAVELGGFSVGDKGQLVIGSSGITH